MGDPFEKAGFMHPFERETRFAFFMDRGDLDLGGIRQKSAHHHARAVPERMHPEQLVGRPVLDPEEALDFRLGGDHGGI